jgi:multiple sugar transport system permease protein
MTPSTPPRQATASPATWLDRLAGRLGWPRSAAGRREARSFYLFASPYLVGLVCFTVGPILISLYLSFTNYNAAVWPPRWLGLYNYQFLFLRDADFRQALKVTLVYTAMAVPLLVVVPLLVAILLNRRVRGLAVFRTVFYLPSVLSGVAVAMLWIWLLNPRFGVVNWLLGLVRIPGPGWLADERWALPALVLMAVWGMGNWVVINLAALQGVPTDLQEQATVDGANAFLRFRHVVLPMISPVILFNAVIAAIGSFQTFTQAFIMTAGGPNKATYFYNLYLYEKAFRSLQMGMASAMAWVLFVLILLCTALIFWVARNRVYYASQ